MKIIGFFALICSFFLSTTLSAMEQKTGGYSTGNYKIKMIIESDSLFAYSYGILRRAYEIKDTDFMSSAHALWRTIKLEKKLDQAKLQDLVLHHWHDLTSEQQELAEDLALIESLVSPAKKNPHFWEHCESCMGSTSTSILQEVAVLAIVSCFVVTPVAATIAATVPYFTGTFRDSCRDIRVESYKSRDPHLDGDLAIVRAQCPQDRACHGFINNEIVIPADGSTCKYIHNNNGTLMVSDSMYSSLTGSASPSSSSCPSLEGSFRETCDMVFKRSYKSTDDRVPDGAYCVYDSSCKMLNGDNHANTLHLAKASVGCTGKLIENCNGKLHVRTGHGEDHQCDKNWKQGKKEL